MSSSAKGSEPIALWQAGEDLCKQLTRPQLQSEASRLGLSSTGTKAVLSARLEEFYRQQAPKSNSASHNKTADDSSKADKTYLVTPQSTPSPNSTFLVPAGNSTLVNQSSSALEDNKSRGKRNGIADAKENKPVVDIGAHVTKAASKDALSKATDPPMSFDQIHDAIEEFFSDKNENDYRCETSLDFVPRISVNGFELKYPIDDEIAARLVYQASSSDDGLSLQISPKLVSFPNGEKWISTFGDQNASVLLQHIATALAPQSASVQAELAKLIVLKKGSSLPAKWNAQVAENHFGTAVVFLPSLYQGGDLLVTHGSAVRRYSFEKVDSLNCHMVAFFCDSARFEPIMDGCSIVLQYNLLFHGPTTLPKPPLPNVINPKEKHFLGLFEKLVRIPEWSDRTIGFLLSSNYPVPCKPIMLANNDRLAYEALMASGLFDVTIVDVVVSTSGTVREPVGTWARKCYREALLERNEINFTIKQQFDSGRLVGGLKKMMGREELARFTFPHGRNREGLVHFINDLTRVPVGDEMKEDVQPADRGLISFSFIFRKTALLIKPKS